MPAFTEFFNIFRGEGVVAVDLGRVGAIESAAGNRGRAGELGEEGIILCPLVTVGNDFIFPEHGSAVDTYGCVEVGTDSVACRFLGRNEDYAECTAGTVNGAGCCILEDRDALDVFRVYGRKVTFHAVDHHETASALTHGTGFKLGAAAAAEVS